MVTAIDSPFQVKPYNPRQQAPREAMSRGKTAMVARHDHSSMGDMDMGSDADMMSMGSINVYHFPRVFWSFIGAVIAVFALCNAYEYLLYRQRMRAAKRFRPFPSMPKTWYALVCATLTAVTREISYAALPSQKISRTVMLRFPSVGPLGLVFGYLALLLTMLLYDLDLSDRWMYETIAYRAGIMSLAQLPLIVLLAGKNNLIGIFTGMSYERLNWVHRWIARCLLISTTVHFAHWLMDWAPYDGYITHQIMNDHKTKRGLGAWCILLWIVFSSFAPIRNWSYQFFVVQHVLSFTALFVIIYYHLPPADRAWVWVALGLFVFDRVTRWTITLYNNLSLFHRNNRQADGATQLWASRAQFTPVPGNMTRVTVRDPSIKWRPGQHAFVSCHSLVPFQSHPFTISSIPEDGKLEFFVRAHRGATKRFLTYAEKSLGLPISQRQPIQSTKTVTIDGPYGRIRPLQQFDSLCFIAGGSGLTFTAPLFRDLVRQWQSSTPVVTRHVHFVWVFRSQDHTSWFGEELSQAMATVKSLQASGRNISLEMGFFLTGSRSCHDHPTSITDIEVSKKDQVDIAAIRKTSSSEELSFASDADSSKDGREYDAASERIEQPLIPNRLHPSIKLLEGRPDIRESIREVLEQAQGETAVLACGPRGLNDDARRSVASLSDERAVHKGTGAQGVWFWGETFGW